MLNYLLIIIIVLLIILYCCKNKDNFMCNDNAILLNESKEKSKQIIEDNKDITELKMTNKIWNYNNTLDSRLGNPHVTAPDWWYPKDKYDAEKFKSKWYSDKYDAIYNEHLLGDSRSFWQFS